jgi:hypothetical protein
MNSFEERLGAALADVRAPVVDANAGRTVYRTYVRGRRRRQRLTIAVRMMVVTIVATVGGAAIFVRADDAPSGERNAPVVTPPDPGHRNVGQDDGSGNGSSCLRRSFGGCQILG